jgi:RNA polymerase sigma factor (sigma-70 family)
VDHLRRAGRERPLLEADAAARGSDAPATAAARIAGCEPDPALVAERADLARHVTALLDGLPAPQRETIDLWCEGLSTKQIADITGRTEGHVRVLAHRGLAALRGHPQVRTLLTEHGGRDAATTMPHHAPRGTP